MQKNYYQLLGIKETASQGEIKDAYRKLSKRIHPDLNQGEPFFEEYFKEVLEAYDTLSNLEKKRTYDSNRFSPPRVGSQSPTRNIEFEITRLQMRLRDQNELVAALQQDKKSLSQELDHFVKALFEVKNERSALQRKVQEQEMEVNVLKQALKKGQQAPAAPQPPNQQKRLQALELELQQCQQSIASKTEELALEAQLKRSLEKKVQELTQQVSRAKQQDQQTETLLKESVQQKQKLQQLEAQAHQLTAELARKQQELALAQQQKHTLLQNLQEMEKSQQPAPETNPSPGSNPNDTHRQIKELTSQRQALQNRVHELELETTHLRQKLEDSARHLAQETVQKNGALQTAEAQAAQLQDLQTTLAQTTQQLEQVERQKQALYKQVAALAQEKEHLAAQLQEKTGEAHHLAEKTTELQQQYQAAHQQTAQLQATLREREQQLTQERKEAQQKEQTLAAAAKQKQELQQQLKEVKQKQEAQQVALQVKIQEVEKEAAQKRSLEARITALEKEKATHQLEITELKKETVAVRAKYAHLGHIQPFLVEHMDFFNSDKPKEYGTSFERGDIKYIFSRMKIIPFAQTPGQLSVLVKYIKPNGQLYFNPQSSPTGYSFAATLRYDPKEEYLYLSGWGSDQGGSFVAGDHRVEIYDESGRQLSKANFQVKEQILKLSKLKSFF
ncbi:J domain-containing protein [Rufibacter psychrotolerans]|uniref:J domain-containing protein n=1 Tax=Rufibacter psychrotolerans TaxID=2812556 RepID=UPI001967437B|nr:DnaJ domain-containing protein [Rufibacter sp. SYSU D00308]